MLITQSELALDEGILPQQAILAESALLIAPDGTVVVVEHLQIDPVKSEHIERIRQHQLARFGADPLRQPADIENADGEGGAAVDLRQVMQPALADAAALGFDMPGVRGFPMPLIPILPDGPRGVRIVLRPVPAAVVHVLIGPANGMPVVDVAGHGGTQEDAGATQDWHCGWVRVRHTLSVFILHLTILHLCVILPVRGFPHPSS